MERIYGRALLADRQIYAGKTDQQIIMETFTERAQDELLLLLEPFTAAYLQELDTRQLDFLAHGRVLDGVVAALERLATQPVIPSLLTGNILQVARLKLDLMGLSSYFNFDVGAFGSDHHIRSNLVPIAAARAEQRYGRPFVGQDVVVIGDTPNDIACGRAAGARTVAVATGPFSVAELQGMGPTWCWRAWRTPRRRWRRSLRRPAAYEAVVRCQSPVVSCHKARTTDHGPLTTDSDTHLIIPNPAVVIPSHRVQNSLIHHAPSER